MAEMTGQSVVIKVSGAPVAMTGQATTALTDNIRVQITDAARRVIDWESPVTVKESGVATTESYRVHYLSGIIEFSAIDAGRGPITIDGKYLPMSVAAYANAFSRETSCELLDAPRFGQTHIKRIAGLKSASGTLTHLDITDTTFVDALTDHTPIVIEDRATAGTEPSRVIAILESVETNATAEELQDQTVGWISTSDYTILEG